MPYAFSKLTFLLNIMNPLMLRTPAVFARPSSVDVSEIKARTATISDPDDNLDTIAPSEDDDLTLHDGHTQNWPLNAGNTTTIYPPIASTGPGAATEVDHWKVKDSPFHLVINVDLHRQLDELHLNESLSSGLLSLSQQRLTDVADETWTTTSGPQSGSIILAFAQQRDSVQESLEWRQLITLFGKPNGIWGYYATTRRLCEIQFAVWDYGRAKGEGVCCAQGSVRRG